MPGDSPAPEPNPGGRGRDEALKDALKDHMGDQETLSAGEYYISWKPVKSSRVDTVALRKALPEVAQAFTKTTTTRRFCVA